MSPDDHVTEDFNIRDLRKEIEAKKTQTFKECDRCGKKWTTPLSLRRLKNHYDHPACRAHYRERQLKDAGFATITEGSLIHKVMQAAGIAVKREPTNFEKGRGKAWGRGEAHRNRLKDEIWVPRWVTKLLEDSWRITRGFNNEDSVPMLAIFLKELFGDVEKRQAAFATMRLGGPDSLHQMIFTRAFRAKKLRAEAAKKMEEALALEAQANELDPPPEPSDE